MMRNYYTNLRKYDAEYVFIHNDRDVKITIGISDEDGDLIDERVLILEKRNGRNPCYGWKAQCGRELGFYPTDAQAHPYYAGGDKPHWM